MGNSAAGLHMGSLGGLWQAAVLGFGGVAPRQDGLSFDPHLPPGWRGLRFPLRWRGRRLSAEVSGERRLLEVRLEQGQPISIYAGGSKQRLGKGRPITVPLAREEEEQQ
jgi:alpha,alpha-trehalose phosphorylase